MPTEILFLQRKAMDFSSTHHLVSAQCLVFTHVLGFAHHLVFVHTSSQESVSVRAVNKIAARSPHVGAEAGGLVGVDGELVVEDGELGKLVIDEPISEQ
jgi:hypothetical protein